MTGIRDIAKRAGTSIATVSRALNDSGYVRADTRARIEQAMHDLQFAPNAGARLMRRGTSRVVGVLVPALDVHFFGILAHTLEQELFARDYHAIICSTAESEEREMRYISALLAQRVDGVLAVSVSSDGVPYRRLVEKGIPVVALDRALPGITDETFTSDHALGGRMMVQHLRALGHRRIAVVGAPDHSTPIQDRLRGVTEELALEDLSPVAVHLGRAHTFEVCRDLTLAMLAGGAAPTAIIGTTDIAAIGAVHAVVAQGMSVPGDVSVIGFDDLPAARYVIPPLTTVAQPLRALGRVAVARLCGLMAGQSPTEPDATDLSLRLVERGTTAPVRV